jgi:hypothetical protein
LCQTFSIGSLFDDSECGSGQRFFFERGGPAELEISAEVARHSKVSG